MSPSATRITLNFPIEHDGLPIEIDAVNLVRKVGGVDQMEAVRMAIGV